MTSVDANNFVTTHETSKSNNKYKTGSKVRNRSLRSVKFLCYFSVTKSTSTDCFP